MIELQQLRREDRDLAQAAEALGVEFETEHDPSSCLPLFEPFRIADRSLVKASVAQAKLLESMISGVRRQRKLLLASVLLALMAGALPSAWWGARSATLAQRSAGLVEQSAWSAGQSADLAKAALAEAALLRQESAASGRRSEQSAEQAVAVAEAGARLAKEAIRVAKQADLILLTAEIEQAARPATLDLAFANRGKTVAREIKIDAWFETGSREPAPAFERATGDLPPGERFLVGIPLPQTEWQMLRAQVRYRDTFGKDHSLEACLSSQPSPMRCGN